MTAGRGGGAQETGGGRGEGGEEGEGGGGSGGSGGRGDMERLAAGQQSRTLELVSYGIIFLIPVPVFEL